MERKDTERREIFFVIIMERRDTERREIFFVIIMERRDTERREIFFVIIMERTISGNLYCIHWSSNMYNHVQHKY